MIPNRVSIDERPLGATNKTRYKHFECDTAVAPRRVSNTESIAFSVERKSNLILAKKIPSLSPRDMTQAMKSLHTKVHMLSTTADNGIENKYHEDWDVPVYFADPHSPWQKPVVENNIGLLRRWFFKKGTDWSQVSEEELQDAVDTLNNKYRKSLGYQSAMEVAVKNNILKESPT
jgi:IS30 family transposase